MRATLLLLSISATSLVGCSSPPPPQSLSGTGSTFIAPIMKKWEGDYASKGKFTYEAVGSTIGLQRLDSGAFDFVCSDEPMTDDQIEKVKKARGEVVHIPLVLGAVVPAYNLDIDTPLTFSGPVLADIYLGKITRWDDMALAELNPGVKLPENKEITVLHRTEGGGTSYVWTDYLAKVSPEWKSKVGVGAKVEWPTGVGAIGNEALAARLKKTPGGISYMPLTYAIQNGEKTGLVKNKAGAAIKPSLESVTAAASGAVASMPDDLRFSLTDPPGADAYPICATTWAIVFKQPTKPKELTEFLRWTTHEGQDQLAPLSYARLPAGLVARIDQKIAQLGGK